MCHNAKVNKLVLNKHQFADNFILDASKMQNAFYLIDNQHHSRLHRLLFQKRYSDKHSLSKIA